ncbi:MAG: alpha-galactosidase [Treponema sp.]|nr:alpha-galactosidase [Candidatus Treponema equi]
MKGSEFFVKNSETFLLNAGESSVKVLKYTWNSTGKDNFAPSNSCLGEFRLYDLGCTIDAKKSWVSPGGWQSWNPSFEVAPHSRLSSLKCHVVPQWNAYLQVPGHKYKRNRNNILCQFVAYLRNGSRYFFICSTGRVENNVCLPPLYYEVDRSKAVVRIIACDQGKVWNQDEKAAEVCFFECDSYFTAKDCLSKLYENDRFDCLSFLGKEPGGWESWYNHYANIDENLVLEDLASLSCTENVISTLYLKEKKPAVFQIDDGWEKGLGFWEPNARFPSGLKFITEKIESASMIPGLWIAPFIVDIRNPVYAEHPDWILRDEKGKLVKAGYNPAWGKHGTFYALDLSNNQVLTWIDGVIDTAINVWGFRYLKLDFLYAGMLYGRHANGGSAYEWFDRAIKKLTSRKFNKDGMPVAYLGCGTPLELSFNVMPLSRIGCDTFEHWENKIARRIGWNGRNSACLNLKDTIGHAIWNKSIFWCDPDVIFARKENCTLSDDEKKLIAFTAFAFGNQVMYSDDPAKCTGSDEHEMTKEICAMKKKFADEEFSVESILEDIFEIKSRSGKYRGYINISDRNFSKDGINVKPHSYSIIG